MGALKDGMSICPLQNHIADLGLQKSSGSVSPLEYQSATQPAGLRALRVKLSSVQAYLRLPAMMTMHLRRLPTLVGQSSQQGRELALTALGHPQATLTKGEVPPLLLCPWAEWLQPQLVPSSCFRGKSYGVTRWPGLAGPFSPTLVTNTLHCNLSAYTMLSVYYIR